MATQSGSPSNSEESSLHLLALKKPEESVTLTQNGLKNLEE